MKTTLFKFLTMASMAFVGCDKSPPGQAMDTTVLTHDLQDIGDALVPKLVAWESAQQKNLKLTSWVQFDGSSQAECGTFWTRESGKIGVPSQAFGTIKIPFVIFDSEKPDKTFDELAKAQDYTFIKIRAQNDKGAWTQFHVEAETLTSAGRTESVAAGLRPRFAQCDSLTIKCQDLLRPMLDARSHVSMPMKDVETAK